MASLSGERGVLSGGGWEPADAVERADVVAVPRPAGREVQCSATGVTGQAAGNCEQSAAQGARGADGRSGQPEQLRPPEHVVRQGPEHGPGAVGVKVPGWEVRPRQVLEIRDDLLDNGVLAVLGLDQDDVVGAVGEQREVGPVGP